MNKLTNDRLIRALLRQPLDRTPVWIMRQAGRYMPEYRALRASAGDFLTLCKTPELACEVTLLPINRFALDAAILFSDILVIPDAMGCGLHFVADEGPKFSKVIDNARDINNLPDLDPEQDLGYVMQAIRLIVKELDNKIPLIGFAGSPWTIATYMVEGQSAKQFNKIKALLYKEPLLLKQLLEHLSQQIIKYLCAQINAGVNVVMLFDTWGGILTDLLYTEFSLYYMQQIVRAVKNKYPTIPVILFTKNGGRCLSAIAESGCDAVGLDWTADLSLARRQVGNYVALQGNMDPSVLYANQDRINAEVQAVLAAYGHGTGHVFNLGHGIAQDTPPENVEILLSAVREYSPKYHSTTVTV